jgi:hypothetical protein
VSAGAVESYTFDNVTAAHTIEAVFAADTVTITASAQGSGQITPSGAVSVPVGGTEFFDISPEAGHLIHDVFVDGVSVGAVTRYKFHKVTAAHTIEAVFVPETVTITSVAEGSGQITPSGTVSVAGGGSQTYTMAPDSGYVIADVIVDGISIGAADAYTFADVTTNHEIVAVFEMAPHAPVADAGPDQRADEQATVRLCGFNSVDLDDGIASFQWSQIQGTPVDLAGVSEPECTFTAPTVGTNGESLVFQLSVTDYSGTVRTDSCIVNVSWENRPPVAEAGQNQRFLPGETVVLDGGASADPEAGGLTFSWSQVEGTPVTLSNPYTAQTSFTAPEVAAAGETLRFELTVTDDGGLMSQDTCLVTVSSGNEPPVAASGDDRFVFVGERVMLDATGAYDIDGGIALYLWKQLSGPPVMLSDSTAMMPEFKAPSLLPGRTKETLVFMLTVTDAQGIKDSDTCAVSVEELGEFLFLVRRWPPDIRRVSPLWRPILAPSFGP